jgi:ankyrin repeat protein
MKTRILIACLQIGYFGNCTPKTTNKGTVSNSRQTKEEVTQEKEDLPSAYLQAAQGNVDFFKNAAKSVFADIDSQGRSVLLFAAQNVSRGVDILKQAQSVLSKEELLKVCNSHYELNGHTPLTEAVFQNNEAMGKVLIEISGIDTRSRNVMGWTPRALAERNGLSWAKQVPAEPGFSFPEPYLQDRIKWISEQQETWVKSQADQEKARLGLDLLNTATTFDISAVDALLKKGVNINGRYGYLQTTVLIAVANGLGVGPKEDAMERGNVFQKQLLQRGADPLISEEFPMGVHAGYREAVFGIDPLLENIIAHLKSKNANVKDYLDTRGVANGYTKLIDAAFNGRIGILRMLLAEGVNTQTKGYNGLNAREAALDFNNRAKTNGRALIPDDILEKL